MRETAVFPGNIFLGSYANPMENPMEILWKSQKMTGFSEHPQAIAKYIKQLALHNGHIGAQSVDLSLVAQDCAGFPDG